MDGADDLPREEREALRVVALVRSRRHEEARSRATEFFATYPQSLHRAVVEAALQSGDP